MSPAVHTQILLVEGGWGRLSAMAPDLARLDFEVLTARTVDEAVGIVERTPLLAIVVADDGITSSECAKLVASVRSDHPDLPVLWTPQEATDVSVFGDSQPDVILDPNVDCDDIRTHAEFLLRQHLYPDAIVEMIRDKTRTALVESFNTQTFAGQPCLKANRNALAPITAILPFHGARISGLCVVSAKENHLRIIHRRFLGGDGDVPLKELEDLSGEIANRILGRIKAYFVARGEDFKTATPVFLRGDMVEVRNRSGRPSLVIPFQESDGTLFLQFCFDTFDPGTLDAEADDESVVDEGEVHFL